MHYTLWGKYTNMRCNKFTVKLMAQKNYVLNGHKLKSFFLFGLYPIMFSRAFMFIQKEDEILYIEFNSKAKKKC